VPAQVSSSAPRFLAAAVFSLWFYYGVFLDVDIESFGANELLQEGLSAALGLFLVRRAPRARAPQVTWITAFNALHVAPQASVPEVVAPAPTPAEF
jgi:hypothetical protein